MWKEVFLVRPTDDYDEFRANVLAALKLTSNKSKFISKDEDPVLLASCLFAAYNNIGAISLAKMTGTPVARIRAMITRHRLPRNRAEYMHLVQMGILAQIMHQEGSEMVGGLNRLARVLNKGCALVETLMDRAEETGSAADLAKLSKLMSSLAKLSVPVSFLYRDSLDAGLNERFDYMAKHKWTGNELNQMIKLISPPPAGTPPGQAGKPRG